MEPTSIRRVKPIERITPSSWRRSRTDIAAVLAATSPITTAMIDRDELHADQQQAELLQADLRHPQLGLGRGFIGGVREAAVDFMNHRVGGFRAIDADEKQHRVAAIAHRLVEPFEREP